MGEKVYKKIRVVGCSTESYEKAIEAAVAKAAETVDGLAWFEVVEHRGAIAHGGVAEYQATVDIAFKVN